MLRPELAEIAKSWSNDLRSDTAHLVPKILRLLANGAPVPIDHVSSTLQLPLPRAKSLLTGYGAEFDKSGNLIGLGLTLAPTQHSFTVKGQKLYAWCATDTLIFPMMLNETAQVETVDPVNGERIRLEVGPQGVNELQPNTAVLSVSTNVDARDVRGSFCAFGHWFGSPKTASEYALKHHGIAILNAQEVREIFRAILAPDMIRTISQKNGLTRAEHDGLAHAFEFDLEAAPDRKPYVSAKDREGVFVVNGVGTVKSDVIRGRIKMSFFAQDCAYLLVQAGIDPGPGQHLCKESDGGVIETEDGAKIFFDTRGYGLRGADSSFPKRWRLSMTAQFSTSDQRYSWLNTTFGLWEGQFDEEKGKAIYKGYVRRHD